MFELNLIREKTRLSQKKRTFSRIGYLTILFLVLLIFLNLINVYAHINAAQRELATVQRERDEKKALIGIGRIEPEWQEYLHQLQSLDGNMQQRTYWAPRLKKLSLVLPPEICLLSLNVDIFQAVGQVQLDIIVLPAKDREFGLVNKFMDAVGKDPLFSSTVKLASHVKTNVNDISVERFGISIPLQVQQ